MPIEDPRTLISEGEDALVEGDHAQARYKFRRARDATEPRSNARADAERFLRHLGEDDNAEVFQLQQRIVETTDPEQKLSLLTQAREQGLEILITRPDLPRLDRLFDEAETELRAQRESEAQMLLEEAKAYYAREEFGQAVRLGEEALDLAPLGEEVKAEIQNHLTACKKAQNQIQQREDLIEDIQALLTDRQYGDALEKAQEALYRYPEDAQLLDLRNQAQIGANVVTRVQEELLPEAEEKEEHQPQEALNIYEEIIQTAEAQGLSDLVEVAQTGWDRAQRLREQKIEEAQALVAEAAAALEEEDFDTALDYYEQALDADPHNEEAAAGRKRAAAQKHKIDESKSLKETGRRRANAKEWAEALDLFKDAQVLNPDDPELAELLQEAEFNITEVTTVLDTIKTANFVLDGTLVTTPQQFSEWTTIHILENDSLSQAKRANYSNAADASFAREATTKLTRYLKPAENWISKGTRGYVSEEALAALNSRLIILSTYRTDIKQAQATWERLSPIVSRGEQALETGCYEDAADAYLDVLQSLRESPIEAHYLLGKRDDGVFTGVWGGTRAQFIDAARSLARKWKDPLRDTARRVKSLLDQLNPEGAAEVLNDNAPPVLLDRIHAFKEAHARLTDQPFPLSDVWINQITKLNTEVNQQIRLKTLYAKGRQFVLEGHLEAAEQRFKQMIEIDANSQDARLGLKGVAHLRQLSECQKQAEQAGDLTAEWEALQELVRLATRWEWASNRLQEVKEQLAEEQTLNAWRISARSYKKQSNPDAAKQWAEKVLEEAPGDPEMIDIVSWADTYRAGEIQRETWKKEARKTFKLGMFQDTLDYTDKVLQQDEHDSEAQRLRNRAEHALTLYRDASRLVHTDVLDQSDREHNLQKAEQKLKEIQLLNSVGGEWADLLDEVLDKLDDLHGLESQLQEVSDLVQEAESDEIRWLDILDRTRRLAEKSPQARLHFRKARHKVKKIVRSAIKDEAWEIVKRGIDALQRAGVDDTRIREWVQQYERADLVRRASIHIEQGIIYDLDSLLIQLESYLEQHTLDTEIRDLRRQTLILQLKHKAETAIKARDYETAKNQINDALALNPNKEIRKSLQTWLDQVKVQLALQTAKTKIKEGTQLGLEQAIEILESVVNLEDERVTRLLQKARSIRDLLEQAAGLAEEGEMRAAIKRLDEVLKLHHGFQLAVERREHLIEQHLEKARQAELQEDLWKARELYKELEGIYPLAQTPYRSIKNRLNTQMNRIAHESRRALSDPDIQLTKVKALLTNLQQIPPEICAQRRTFKEYTDALPKLERDLQDVEDLFQQAKSALRAAHPIGQEGYSQVEHYLNRIQDVEGRFAQRTAVRELKRSLHEHRQHRQQVKQAYAQYIQVRATWQQSVSPVGADFAPPVQRFLQEGLRQLDEALALNREIREKDGENLYRIRPQFEAGVGDPLAEEYESLLRQKSNLKNTAEHLLEGIRRRDEGNAHAELAQNLHDEATQDKDFKDAKTRWQQAITAYELALDSLGLATDTESLSERASALASDAEQLSEKVSRDKAKVEKSVEDVNLKIGRLEDLRREAGQNYGDRLWMAALANYEEILTINPRDKEAQRKRSELSSKLRLEKETSKRRKRLLTFGSLGSLVSVALLITGWYFVFGPGQPPPTLSPTPTLPFTREPEAGAVGATSTWTPEPTEESSTPAPAVSTTPQISLEMFDETRKCIISNDTVVYQQPDQALSLGRTLNAGKGFDALGQTEDGQWLFVEIVGYDETWILAEDTRCVP
jgi:tetratricopeptide (TPR) repeat protein